jgi:xylulokinase
VYKSVPEACDATIGVLTRQSGDPSVKPVYDGYHKLYGSLYKSLAADFKTLAALAR